MISLLRQTLRSLSRAPGYAVAASLTLAVGLAAALAAFAPAWELLGVPFDFRDPTRIVSLSGEGAGGADFLRQLSAPDFRDLQKDLASVEHLAACRDAWLQLDFPEGPKGVRTVKVSPGFFKVLGLPLLLGRDFEEQDAKVVILEHGFWMRRFGGDPRVLGRSLDLDGVPHQIAGVLAPQRRMPFFLDDALAFQPLVLRQERESRDLPSAWVFGRLAKGASLAQLQTELDRLAPRLGPSRAAWDRSWGIRARGLMSYWRGRVAPELALTVASGLLVLLLACANVAHLMLARNLGRTREWGLRAALGAGWRGLRAPILMEAALLILLGSLLALPLLKGLWALRLLEGLGPRSLLPLGAALGLAFMATALLPLRWAARLDLNEALKEGGAASASTGSNRLRGALAVVQLALAFALLVATGLGLRALERLRGLDPGYALKHLHMAILRLDMRPQDDFKARSAAFQRGIRESMSGAPGIEAVGMSNTLALRDQGHEGEVWPEGAPGSLRAGLHAVSPDYFRTLRIPLLAGQDLEEGKARSCVVSASLARRCWGEDSPLGRQLRLFSAGGPPFTVVGVVGEARMGRLAREGVPAIYTSLAQEGAGYITVYLRSALPPIALRPTLLEAARQADGGVRLTEFDSLESVAARELERPRALQRMTLGAALLAAFLAGIGVAGTLSQAAARQRREWGIRMALGANPAMLFGLVFRRVLALLVAGLALGLALAWALGRLLQHALMGVSPADPTLLALAMSALALVSFLAGLGPALRAARMDPAKALRSE